MQIQVYSMKSSGHSIGQQINKWLNENETVEVIDIKYTSICSHASPSGDEVSALIIYKPSKEEPA